MGLTPIASICPEKFHTALWRNPKECDARFLIPSCTGQLMVEQQRTWKVSGEMHKSRDPAFRRSHNNRYISMLEDGWARLLPMSILVNLGDRTLQWDTNGVCRPRLSRSTSGGIIFYMVRVCWVLSRCGWAIVVDLTSPLEELISGDMRLVVWKVTANQKQRSWSHLLSVGAEKRWHFSQPKVGKKIVVGCASAGKKKPARDGSIDTR